MLKPLVADGRGRDMYPTTEEELVSALREFDEEFRREGDPRMVVMFADPKVEDTPRLSIGLGADESVLAFDESVERGIGGFSVGAREGDHSEVDFAYGSDWSSFYASNLVPKHAAFEAAQEFFRTGRRPTSVAWEDQ